MSKMTLASFKRNWKRYAFSAGVTFTATFCAVMALSIEKLSLESLQNGVMAGLVLAAIRTGLKGVFEQIALSIHGK